MTEEEINKKAEKHCNEVLCNAHENCNEVIKCRDWRSRRAGFFCGYEQALKDFEKENAELKEALKGKVCNCMTYLNFKDLEKECAKAKVFIRNLKNLIEDVCDINYLSKDNTRLLVEAEQFISEVEE